jgi:hypothetical protein
VVAAGGGRWTRPGRGGGEVAVGDAGCGTAVLAEAGWVVGAGVAGGARCDERGMAINAKHWLRKAQNSWCASPTEHLGFRQVPGSSAATLRWAHCVGRLVAEKAIVKRRRGIGSDHFKSVYHPRVQPPSVLSDPRLDKGPYGLNIRLDGAPILKGCDGSICCNFSK